MTYLFLAPRANSTPVTNYLEGSPHTGALSQLLWAASLPPAHTQGVWLCLLSWQGLSHLEAKIHVSFGPGTQTLPEPAALPKGPDVFECL